jgi:4-diphosphocytidyl-2-C-methyl-D-erythritol kinase
MHKIDFFDNIEIKKTNFNSINLKTNVEEINNQDNLSYKAAVKFFDRARIKPQVSIEVEKHIPLGGGLGGGSSNAAYTLLGLNKMFDFPLTDKDVYDIASMLGSDVAFFLCRKPAAIAKGRGEILQEVECSTKDYKVFLAIPKIHISTAYIYSKLPKLLLTIDKPINKMPFVINSGSCELEAVKPHLCNDLEEVALSEFKELKKLKSVLVGHFGNALLSGSGASMFSITNPEVRAEEELGELLVSEGVFCKTVNFAS